MKPHILHISGDFPDSIVPAKSRVIQSLLDLTAERFDHHVYSLNRVSPGPAFAGRVLSNPLRPALPVSIRHDAPNLRAVRYDAPGRGIYHKALLMRLAAALADDLARSGPAPALIVGHKLTIEGLVAAEIAKRLGVPFALCIQGNTDARILKMRPDLKSDFVSIWHGAAIAFPFTPWARDAVEAKLGQRQGPTPLLPCPTPADAIISPKIVGPKLVTAFHLRHQDIKNAPALIKAAGIAARSVPGLTLDIIGDGSAAEKASLQVLIDAEAAGVAQLVGPVPHGAMQARLNGAGGFAMPSKRESFGLVFVEALLAGCPILYPRGTAVDGYFDGLSFAIAVDGNDPASIAQGMVRLARDEASLKADLAQWLASDAPKAFQRPAIAATFGNGLARTLG